jgi:flagellin
MSLRINTNVAALNSYNNLNANQSKLEAAFQQLSSGLRINKAADDAAGLSIAQGLTSQINGLTQAVSNANDGINVAQIADGALGTTQDILQRMRGLIVKAGNVGTQDSDSLGAIQSEIKNLNTQLDNIASQTKFGQTNLLDGSYNKNFQVGANGGDIISLNLSTANVASTSVGGENLNNLAIASAAGGSVTSSADFGAALQADLAAGTFTGNEATVLNGASLFNGAALGVQAAPSGQAGWVVTGTGGANIGTITQGPDGTFTITDTTGATPKVLGTVNTMQYDPNFSLGTIAGVNFNGAAADSATAKAVNTDLKAAFGAQKTGFQLTGDATNGWTVKGDTATAGTYVTLGKVTVSNGVYTFTDTNSNVIGGVNANVGAKAPTGDLTYSTSQATSDLDMLNNAINGISNARSQIGAVQNQLSYTVSNLQTAITNVTASRSNLTDADLAQQVTAMTQSQILTQAATSVLAQANSAPQAILKLLQ